MIRIKAWKGLITDMVFNVEICITVDYWYFICEWSI